MKQERYKAEKSGKRDAFRIFRYTIGRTGA